MPLTELTRIPLEGEQAQLFAELEREERDAIAKAQAPFSERRAAWVSAILAGKGLLASVRETGGADIRVESDHLAVIPPTTERALTLDKSGEQGAAD